MSECMNNQKHEKRGYLSNYGGSGEVEEGELKAS